MKDVHYMTPRGGILCKKNYIWKKQDKILTVTEVRPISCDACRNILVELEQERLKAAGVDPDAIEYEISEMWYYWDDDDEKYAAQYSFN